MNETATTLQRNEMDHLESLRKQGEDCAAAVAALGVILCKMLDFQESEDCPQCKKDHEELTSERNRAGIYLALQVLGSTAANNAERMARILDGAKRQQGVTQ